MSSRAFSNSSIYLEFCLGNGVLERNFLQSIQNNLEKIENKKAFLDEEDKKVLKRNKMMLMDTFERTKNIAEFKVNVEIIKEIFNGL